MSDRWSENKDYSSFLARFNSKKDSSELSRSFFRVPSLSRPFLKAISSFRSAIFLTLALNACDYNDSYKAVYADPELSEREDTDYLDDAYSIDESISNPPADQYVDNFTEDLKEDELSGEIEWNNSDYNDFYENYCAITPEADCLDDDEDGVPNVLDDDGAENPVSLEQLIKANHYLLEKQMRIFPSDEAIEWTYSRLFSNIEMDDNFRHALALNLEYQAMYPFANLDSDPLPSDFFETHVTRNDVARSIGFVLNIASKNEFASIPNVNSLDEVFIDTSLTDPSEPEYIDDHYRYFIGDLENVTIRGLASVVDNVSGEPVLRSKIVYRGSDDAQAEWANKLYCSLSLGGYVLISDDEDSQEYEYIFSK